MKNYTIEDLKEEFSETKELIISLDNDSKITLKPMVEISSFLKKLAPFEADIVLDELNDMYINGMISDSYLNSKQRKRLSFEMYLQSKKRLIKSKLELGRMQSAKNDINAIERKLNELPTKDSKIEYLIEIKKPFLSLSKELIDNDEVFNYLKARLDDISKLSDNFEQKEKNIPLPQRLQTNLTTKQRSILFAELVNGRFIPKDNKDCFYWAFGVIDEKEAKQPEKWQSIEWLKNVQILRELLEAKEIMTFKDKGDKKKMENKIPLLFEKNGKPRPLAKNKHKPDTDSDKIDEIVKKLATF